MKLLITLLIVSSVLKDVVAEVKEEDILCEAGDTGYLVCEEKHAYCIKIHENNGYKCKCREGFEMTIEEECIEIDYCAPNTDGYLTCLDKNGRCIQDSTKEKGFHCICNDGKICEDEESFDESTENFVVKLETTFSDVVEISDNFSTIITETTTMSDLNINTLSEKSDFSVDTSTHLSEETLPDSSAVTIEISTNPSSFSTLIKKDDNLSINEIRSSTESSSTDRVNEVNSTEPTLSTEFIVGIVSGIIIFVVMILVVLLILKKKKCRQSKNCNLKIGEDYEKKLGALTPTFIHNENEEIIKVPEKTIFSV